MINDVAEPLFLKRTSKNKSNAKCKPNYRSIFKKADWFDRDCHEAKTKYLDYVHMFNRCKSGENRQLMLESKQAYKRLIKSKRLKHQRHNINTIQKLRHSNPREFWKLFNSKSSNKLTPNINIEEFYEYFSKLQDELPKSTNIEAEEFVKKITILIVMVFMKSLMFQ